MLKWHFYSVMSSPLINDISRQTYFIWFSESYRSGADQPSSVISDQFYQKKLQFWGFSYQKVINVFFFREVLKKYLDICLINFSNDMTTVLLTVNHTFFFPCLQNVISIRQIDKVTSFFLRHFDCFFFRRWSQLGSLFLPLCFDSRKKWFHCAKVFCRRSN